MPVQLIQEAIASVEQGMNSCQMIFETQAKNTVTAVVTEVLKTLIESDKMKWPEFVATHINPKLFALTELDERTTQFFRIMMVFINQVLDNIPTLAASFQTFGDIARDPEIRNKLVEGIALPHVKTLIANLDLIKSSIVDNVIGSRF